MTSVIRRTEPQLEMNYCREESQATTHFYWYSEGRINLAIMQVTICSKVGIPCTYLLPVYAGLFVKKASFKKLIQNQIFTINLKRIIGLASKTIFVKQIVKFHIT